MSLYRSILISGALTCTGWSQMTFAFDLGVGLGQETVITSDLIDSGHGYLALFDCSAFASGSKALSFGMTAAYARYDIKSEATVDDLLLKKQGTLSGYRIGPGLTVTAPWQVISPYVGFGILVGNSTFDLASTSTTETATSSLTTELRSKLVMRSETLTGRVGLALRTSSFGGFIEYQAVRQVFVVTSSTAAFVNTRDGEVQARDAGEIQITELYEGLENERFNHDADVIAFGISVRY